jgi:hypothetical protein
MKARDVPLSSIDADRRSAAGTDTSGTDSLVQLSCEEENLSATMCTSQNHVRTVISQQVGRPGQIGIWVALTRRNS